MQQLQEKYKDTYEFQIIPGGMITGDRVAPISQMAQYILGAYTRVEEYAGVKFGELYLNLLREGTEISNSEPPCRAIHVIREIHPEKALDFTHKLQLKIFLEGKSWNSDDTYRELATEFGINADEFITAFHTEESKYGTRQDFQWVQSAGITGFPCIVVQAGGKYYMLAQGYQPLNAVEEVLLNVNKSLKE